MNEKRRLIFLGQISGFALTLACLAQAVSAQEDISRTISDFKLSSLSYEYNAEASFFWFRHITPELERRWVNR